MNRSVLSLATLFIFMGSVVCHTALPARNEEEIFVRLSSDKKLPYDLKTTGFAMLGFYNAVLGRLLKVGDDFDLVPGLLQKGYWDFGRGHYVLIVKDGLRFHNGRKVTARDLEFSLVRYFLTKKRADPSAALRAIAGIDKLVPGQTFRTGMVEGIQVVSDRELWIKLKTFTPAFLYRLTEGWLGIVPQEELNEDYVTWKRYPIGAGNYRVVSADSATGEVLTERTKDAAPLGPRYIRWISDPATTDVDIVGFTPVNPSSASFRADVKADDFGYSALFFNHRSPLGENPNFRAAVAAVVDRERLIEGISWVTPFYEMLLPQFPGRLNVTEKPDLEKARKLLSKVPKHLLDGELVAYSRHGTHKPPPFEELYAERLREQLSKVGIRVRYKVSDDITFSDHDKESVFRLDNRGSGYSDPMITFRAFGKKGFLSAFHPQSTRLDTLLNNAEVAQSRDDYSKALQELARLFDEEKYVILLFKKRNVYWVSERIDTVGFQYGVNFDPSEVRLK